MSVPALGTGAGRKFTIIVSFEVHAPKLAVTMYVVVVDGEATGDKMDELFNAVDGDHEKLVPLDLPANVTFAVSHTVRSCPISIVRLLFTGISMVRESKHPFASFTVSL